MSDIFNGRRDAEVNATFNRLVQCYGYEKAVDIVAGNDPKTNADIQAWKSLGGVMVEPKRARERRVLGPRIGSVRQGSVSDTIILCFSAGGSRASDAAVLLDQPTGDVARTIVRLRKRGLVERVDSGGRGRAATYRLTLRGLTQAERAR